MFTVSPSLSLSLSFSSICVYYVPDNRRDYYRRAMIHARIDQVCSNFAASKKFRNRCRRRVRRLRSRASFGTSRCSRTNSRGRTRRTHERVTILRSPGMENRVNRRDASTASSRSGRSERRLEFPVSMRSRAAATRQLFRKGEKERERERYRTVPRPFERSIRARVIIARSLSFARVYLRHMRGKRQSADCQANGNRLSD